MGRHFFLHTGIGSTLFSAHWKWFDTFFLLTGNGPTLISDNQFPSSVAFWACVAEICSAIPCIACVSNAGVRNLELPWTEEQKASKNYILVVCKPHHAEGLVNPKVRAQNKGY
jgi:hypothetical protein